jgi:hypothetical protein
LIIDLTVQKCNDCKRHTITTCGKWLTKKGEFIKNEVHMGKKKGQHKDAPRSRIQYPMKNQGKGAP